LYSYIAFLFVSNIKVVELMQNKEHLFATETVFATKSTQRPDN
jgi:hypothetical protein